MPPPAGDEPSGEKNRTQTLAQSSSLAPGKTIENEPDNLLDGSAGQPQTNQLSVALADVKSKPTTSKPIDAIRTPLPQDVRINADADADVDPSLNATIIQPLQSENMLAYLVSLPKSDEWANSTSVPAEEHEDEVGATLEAAGLSPVTNALVDDTSQIEPSQAEVRTNVEGERAVVPEQQSFSSTLNRTTPVGSPPVDILHLAQSMNGIIEESFTAEQPVVLVESITTTDSPLAAASSLPQSAVELAEIVQAKVPDESSSNDQSDAASESEQVAALEKKPSEGALSEGKKSATPTKLRIDAQIWNEASPKSRVRADNDGESISEGILTSLAPASEHTPLETMEEMERDETRSLTDSVPGHVAGSSNMLPSCVVPEEVTRQSLLPGLEEAAATFTSRRMVNL